MYQFNLTRPRWSVTALVGVLALFLSLSSCQKGEFTAEPEGNQPVPLLSQSPSSALIQHFVSFVGTQIEVGSIQGINSRDIRYLSNYPDYVSTSIQNNGFFWLVPIQHGLDPDGVRIMYQVPNDVKPFYEGADFVIAANLEDAQHNYDFGVRLISRKVCENGVCTPRIQLVDADAPPISDECATSADCQSGNETLCEFTVVRNNLCVDHLEYAAPGTSCGQSVCAKKKKKIDLPEKCGYFACPGIAGKCFFLTQEGKDCPPNECSPGQPCGGSELQTTVLDELYL